MGFEQTYDYAQADRDGGRRGLAIAGVMAALLALAAVVAWQMMKDAGAPKRKQVQQISLVQPRELPKPPPEPEKPKEEIKEKIDTPPPEARKDDSPPPEAPLKLEGEASPGGTLDVGGGGKGQEYTIPRVAGTGEGRRGFGFYTQQLQSLLQDELNRKDKLRGSEYRATLALWLAGDGKVQRVEMTGSSGDPRIDALIVEAVSAARGFKAPPESMPQPVRLRVTARGAG